MESDCAEEDEVGPLIGRHALPLTPPSYMSGPFAIRLKPVHHLSEPRHQTIPQPGRRRDPCPLGGGLQTSPRGVADHSHIFAGKRPVDERAQAQVLHPDRTGRGGDELAAFRGSGHAPVL